MTDADSFIREVTEEVRQDRMFRWWKRYAPFVLGGIVAVVAGSAAWNWMEHQRRVAAEERGGAFLAAEPTVDSARALVEGIDGPAAPIAQMQLAVALGEAGETAEAIETWRAVAATPGLKPAYADLARLQAARLAVPGMPLAEAEALLAPLVAEDAPYRALALELRAVLRLNAGDSDAALADLQALLATPGLTRGLNARALQMLALLAPAMQDGGADDAAAAPSE